MNKIKLIEKILSECIENRTEFFQNFKGPYLFLDKESLKILSAYKIENEYNIWDEILVIASFAMTGDQTKVENNKYIYLNIRFLKQQYLSLFKDMYKTQVELYEVYEDWECCLQDFKNDLQFYLKTDKTEIYKDELNIIELFI